MKKLLTRTLAAGLLLVSMATHASMVSFVFSGLNPSFFGADNDIEDYGAGTIVRFQVALDKIADNSQTELSIIDFTEFSAFLYNISTDDILSSYDQFDLNGDGGIVVERSGNDISVINGFKLLGSNTDFTSVFFFESFESTTFDGNMQFYSTKFESIANNMGTTGTSIGSFTTEIINTSTHSSFGLFFIMLSLLSFSAFKKSKGQNKAK